MEEKISLAFAVKLKMIFEKEDKFLTYPLGIGFTYKFLDFMKEQSGLLPQEQLNYRGDFARQLNIIPDDHARFIPDSSRLLWNELKHVLTDAVFAESALTDKETEQLEEAIDSAVKFLNKRIGGDK